MAPAIAVKDGEEHSKRKRCCVKEVLCEKLPENNHGYNCNRLFGILKGSFCSIRNQTNLIVLDLELV